MAQDSNEVKDARLNILIPRHLRAEFKAEVARAGLDMSRLVRGWVEQWLNERQAQKTNSAKK